MEQWNKNREDELRDREEFCCLNDFLLYRYIKYENNMKTEKDVLNYKIENLLLYRQEYKEYQKDNTIDPKIKSKRIGEIEEFIKNEKNKLFKIVDSILGKDKHKLLSVCEKSKAGKEIRRYKLTVGNCYFLEYLLETFKFEDLRLIRKGKAEYIDRTTFDIIRMGFEEFTQNPNILLTMEILEKIWREDFSIPYREMRATLLTLQATVYNYSNCIDEEFKEVFWKKAQEELLECEKRIIEFGCKMQNISKD